MKEIDIEWLKKILYSKIDQLSNLIWDNFKTIHYDYFSIKENNIDEQIWKIKEILKNWKTNELEVLIMKKDIIKLTKDFLDKDIIWEILKEKKKLKIIRHIYIIFILILSWLWVIIYSWYFKSFFKWLSCPKQNICKNNIIPNQNITWNSIVKLSGNNITWNNIVQLSWNTLSTKKVNSITWNFIVWELESNYKFENNILTGNIKINSIITDDKVKLDTLKTWFNIKNMTYLLIKDNNLKISTWDILSWSFETTWSLKDNVLLWNLLTWIIVKEKIDENEKKLQWEKLIKYKKEKKKKCPYSGIIKVNVSALNLRENNTKYSKKLWLLRRWTKLEVLKCQKNLKANSWWYKIKVIKTWKIWWVSTIWIWK